MGSVICMPQKVDFLVKAPIRCSHSTWPLATSGKSGCAMVAAGLATMTNAFATSMLPWSVLVGTPSLTV